MLATAAHRPYTKTLAQRPTGFLPVEHLDSAFGADDVDAAMEAISAGRVLVDLSAVVVGSYARKLWPSLRAAFASVVITADSCIDAISSHEQMFPRSNETLGWDTATGRPTLHTIPDDVLDALTAQLEWIRMQVSDNLTPRPLTSQDEREAAEKFGPWMTSFRAARDAGLALWADDIGLRTLARSEGVQTFGTAALLRALEGAGRVEAGTVASALRVLRDEYCVDIEPDDDSWIVESARNDQWRGGPSCLAMTRRAQWLDPRRGWATWRQIVEEVAAHAPEFLPAWVHAATTGIVSAVSDARQLPSLCAGVLVTVTTLTGFDPEAFARCEQASTHALGELDRPRVTDLAIAMSLDLAAQQMPVDQAAALVTRLGADLDEEGRDALRRVLFET